MNSFLKGQSLLSCLSLLASRVICLFEGGHGKEFEVVFYFMNGKRKLTSKQQAIFI